MEGEDEGEGRARRGGGDWEAGLNAAVAQGSVYVGE